jgi:hypothetical protein
MAKVREKYFVYLYASLNLLFLKIFLGSAIVPVHGRRKSDVTRKPMASAASVTTSKALHLFPGRIWSTYLPPFLYGAASRSPCERG